MQPLHEPTVNVTVTLGGGQIQVFDLLVLLYKLVWPEVNVRFTQIIPSGLASVSHIATNTNNYNIISHYSHILKIL